MLPSIVSLLCRCCILCTRPHTQRKAEERAEKNYSRIARKRQKKQITNESSIDTIWYTNDERQYGVQCSIYNKNQRRIKIKVLFVCNTKPHCNKINEFKWRVLLKSIKPFPIKSGMD